MAQDFLDDYVPVEERIRMLYERFPNAQIRCGEPRYETVGDRVLVVQDAEIFTSPSEQRGTKAFATEPFPGKTPYTRDSEQMNCETSAVGRAIALMGIGTKRSIASREDIRNRVPPADEPEPARQPTRAAKTFKTREEAQAASTTV